MALPLTLPLVCPTIIGRAHHLAALDAELDAARAGRGKVVILSGEAGVGKSRLVAQARARASSRGMVVLDGRCFEPDRTLPYAPLLDLVRAALAAQPGGVAAREFAATAPEFVALVPELAGLLPEAASSTAFAAEQHQRRLAHAFVQLGRRLADAQPLLIVVEDLHWSDDASLDVLLHFARHLATRRIALLLTYRNDEVAPGLDHLLALLDRERIGSEMALPRLTQTEVDAMLRAIFDQPQPIRADFLHTVYDLTDGNPFFIEEVIRSLIAAGDIFRAGGRWERRALAELQIPRSVQDAVLRRTQHLGQEAGRVLRLAAVAGRFFDFAVLQALTGHSDEQLLDLVRELVAAQLVVEESADRFAFRHALTRQAIYAELLARERRTLHLTIAETTEQLHTGILEPFLADLSYHFAAGEAWDKAMEYAERAGAYALRLFAPEAATEHFTRALDACARLQIAPSPGLHRERGRALSLLGDFEHAHGDYQAVLSLAREAGDRVAEWHALIDLGDLWAGYDFARAGEHFEQALALARTLGRPEAEAESLARLGIWHLNDERTDEAERCLQSALASFEQAGDRRGVARTIDLLGTVSDIAGDVVEMRQRYERAVALYRELDDRQGLSSTLTTMSLHGGADVFATVVIPPGVAPDQTTREMEEALSHARTIGWRAGEAYALLCQAVSAVWRGHYGVALALSSDGLAIAQEIDHREWMTLGHVTHGLILGDLLLWSQALDHFTQAWTLAHGSGSLYWLHTTLGYRAEALVMHRDLDAAADLLATVTADLPMRALGQRRLWVARARLALARADTPRALRIVERLLATAANLSGVHDIPLLALLRGQSLAALGDRHEEAETALHAALRGAHDRAARPLSWRSHLALGQLYLARGRNTEAVQQYGFARGIAEELAAPLPGDLREAFLSRITAPIPAKPARAGQRDRNMLTARERAVAALVANGLSNRDIAHALFIGERTVETHVGNVLGKLGFASRAQIAAWAVASGLAHAAE